MPGALTPSGWGLTGQLRAAESLKLICLKTSSFITWLCWATQNKEESTKQGSEWWKEMVGWMGKEEIPVAGWPWTIFISRKIRFIQGNPRVRLFPWCEGLRTGALWWLQALQLLPTRDSKLAALTWSSMAWSSRRHPSAAARGDGDGRRQF